MTRRLGRFWEASVFELAEAAPFGFDWRMTMTESRAEPELPLTGPFWFARRIRPYVMAIAWSVLPCPDLVGRWRMRRAARGLVTLRIWPGKQATSADAAQLAMLRLLHLQRETRRAVRGRHREASVMLARACVETLFVGLYCLRDADAIGQLDAGALKGMADAFSYLEDAQIAPSEVIRACIRRLGEPGRRHVQPWGMVRATRKVVCAGRVRSDLGRVLAAVI